MREQKENREKTGPFIIPYVLPPWKKKKKMMNWYLAELLSLRE